MIKRIFAMVLALALVLSMVPAGVSAEGADGTAKAGNHTAEGHSDDCGLTAGWLPWEKSDSLPTGGQYYLTKNVTLSGELYLMQDLTLCLNGFAVTTSHGSKRLISTQAGSGITLTITDCTAYEENGVYHAGALTGGKDSSALGGGAILVRYGTTAKFYDGRITGNTSATVGGAVSLQAASGTSVATFSMFGGEISNNTAISGTKYKTGGAFYVGNGGVVDISGGRITGNTGSGGGVLYAVDNATVRIENATITGNTASFTGAVLHCAKGAQVTIKDSRLTGNICTSTSGGGVIRMDGSKGKVTLSGNTVIAENTLAAGVGDIMLMSTYSDTLQVSELTSGSNVRFCTPNTVPASAGDVIAVSGTQADWNSGWVVFVTKDGTEQYVAYDGNAFSFTQGHIHEEKQFQFWNKSDSLPTQGNWCLTQDVKLSKEATVSGTLELCLNGHTVTGFGGRAYTVNGTLNIYNCGADGGFTGFCHSAHGGVIQNTGTLYAENVKFRNNTTTAGYGGAILSSGTATFKNCLFRKNSAAQGGALSVAGTTVIENCSFTENSAGSAGAVRVAGSKTVLIDGCSFTKNTATVVGAISATSNNVTLTVKDSAVTDNTTTGGYGAVNVIGTAKPIILQGKVTVTGNTWNGAANNLHVQNGTVEGYDVSGLTEGAKLGISLQPGRISAGKLTFTTPNEKNDQAYFESDDASYEICLNEDNRLALKTPDPVSTHKHCLCGTDNAHCSHETQEFFDWTDPGAMPTEGNWCLTVDVTVSKQFSVSKGLNLCLNGHTVTAGEGDGRVYYVTTGGKLSITDCNKAAGRITGATNSAILYNAKGTGMELNLWNGTFTDNHQAGGGGGAIVIQGQCTFHMYGGAITGNSVTSQLKLDGEGKPILDDAGNQTYFASNGGGLFTGTGTVFHMYGGEITGNKATCVEYLKAGATKTSKAGGNGGGVALYGSANLYGGKIADNEAFLGGGVFISGSESVLNLLGTEISGNSATSAGGVLCQSRAVVNLEKGRITGNTATLSGAGIYISTNSKLSMTGGTVGGNTAKTNGGGIYLQGAEGTVSGGTITGNAADKLGGGIYATEENCKLTLSGGTIEKNKALAGGGVIAAGKASFTMTGGKLTGNQTTSAGGGAYISVGSTFTMTGGTVSSNVAKGDGGGLYLLRAATKLSGGSVSGNTAPSGGGIKMNGGKLTLNGVSLTGNRAIGKMTVSSTTGKSVQVPGYGGALVAAQGGYTENGVEYADSPVVDMYNAYVANNYALSAAGGIQVVSKDSRFNMYGGTVTGNTAGSAGGGIYLSTNTVNRITGGTITGNSAKNCGGIYFLNCTAQVSGLTVKDNTAEQGGGAMVIHGKTAVVNMKDMEFSGNTAGGNAGAILLKTYATMSLQDAKVYGNTAKSAGGALYFEVPTYGTFQNVEFYENQATEGAGGAVYLSSNVVVTAESCTFRDNTSGGSGGAAYNKGRLVLEGCKVLNNVSGKQGGGIGSGKVASAMLSDKAGVFATATVVSGNKAAEQGGGIYNNRGCPVYLTDCTVSENTSTMEGGGIYSDGRLGLTDVTVTQNVSGGAGFALYMTPSNFDGHSYITGHKIVTGEMIVKDNENGDIYLGEGTALAVTGESLGANSHMNVTLHSGVLSQWVQGVYDYEGGDLVYTITAGNRSITDPEPNPNAETEEASASAAPAGDILLYALIGVFMVAVAAAAVLLAKKKKTGGK